MLFLASAASVPAISAATAATAVVVLLSVAKRYLNAATAAIFPWPAVAAAGKRSDAKEGLIAAIPTHLKALLSPERGIAARPALVYPMWRGGKAFPSMRISAGFGSVSGSGLRGGCFSSINSPPQT